MDLSGNTVLITGGGSGIGLALAARFLAAGSEVIACGRRADKLAEARARLPRLVTHVADVEYEAGREALHAWATREHPRLNVLINNAGIQRYPRLAEPEPWAETRRELAINLEAPLHLTALFIPHLLRQPRPAIVNVTSGLAFVPIAKAPVYSATKAALRSYTQSLRHQLAATPIRVIELIPPAVDTDLGGPGLHTFGVKLDVFLDDVLPRIARGELEVAHGFAEEGRRATRTELDAIFQRMNG